MLFEKPWTGFGRPGKHDLLSVSDFAAFGTIAGVVPHLRVVEDLHDARAGAVVRLSVNPETEGVRGDENGPRVAVALLQHDVVRSRVGRTPHVLAEYLFQARHRGATQVLKFVVGVDQPLVLRQELVADAEERGREILGLVDQDYVVEVVRGSCFFQRELACAVECARGAKGRRRGPEVMVAYAVCRKELVVYAVPLLVARCAPCVDDAQASPVRRCLRLGYEGVFDQLVEERLQGARLEGDADSPVGMSGVEVRRLEGENDRLARAGKAADSLNAVRRLDDRVVLVRVQRRHRVFQPAQLWRLASLVVRGAVRDQSAGSSRRFRGRRARRGTRGPLRRWSIEVGPGPAGGFPGSQAGTRCCRAVGKRPARTSPCAREPGGPCPDRNVQPARYGTAAWPPQRCRGFLGVGRALPSRPLRRGRRARSPPPSRPTGRRSQEGRRAWRRRGTQGRASRRRRGVQPRPRPALRWRPARRWFLA